MSHITPEQVREARKYQAIMATVAAAVMVFGLVNLVGGFKI